MKKIYFIFFSLMAAFSAQAQQYIPLRVDSTYSWLWSKSIEHDSLITIDWTGNTYNAAGQLTQKRIPIATFNYVYNQDTLFQWATNAEGEPVSRTTTIFNNGKQVSKWRYYYSNGEYTLSQLFTSAYNAEGHDTLFLQQRLAGSNWLNVDKTVRVFDTNGNKLEETEYKADNNQQWQFKNGVNIEYDQLNRPVKESQYAVLFDVKYKVYEEVKHYDNNNRVDTIWQCRYNPPDYSICLYNNIITYTYTGQNVIDRYTQSQYENGTAIDILERTFTGPQVYSNKPDSVLTYIVSDTVAPLLIEHERFEYKNLDDDAVYFRSERHGLVSGIWRLTKVQEEWYHTIPVDSLSGGGTEYIATFPNPCKAGQQIYFKKALADDGELDILIFDVQGRLVAQHELTNQLSVPAPARDGVYSVVIRSKDSLVGISKLVVVN